MKGRLSANQPLVAPFADVWSSRRWLACALLLWVGSCGMYFLTAPGRLDIIDGGIRYDVTESLRQTGKPVLRDRWLPGVWGRDGERYAFYQLGATVTALPFLMLGHWLGHDSLEAKQFAFSLTSVPFAAAVVSFLFLVYGRLGCPLGRALRWSLVVAFCTLLWPYAGSSFDAALQAFWLTLAVWGFVEALASNSRSWALVSAVAFAALVNIQETYVVLGASVLAMAPLSLGGVRERIRLPVFRIVIAGLLFGLLLVFAYDLMRFGNPLDTGRTSVPHPLIGDPFTGFFGLSLSPAKSIFLYCPPYLVALFGLRRLMKSAPARFAPVVVCVAIHILLVSSLKFWAGEWAWGPRYLVASLPLVCLGLPFGLRENRARWGALLCGAGLVVQLLAISVDHQRYYFERSFGSFFWLNEIRMYTDSPLLARPSELLAVLQRRDVEGARALVPGPRPLTMTASIFGPPPQLLPQSPAWMRQYLVFLVPRPWTLWSRYLPEVQRPGPTGLLTAVGVATALAGFVPLVWLVYFADGRVRRLALEHEQVIESQLEPPVPLEPKPVRLED